MAQSEDATGSEEQNVPVGLLLSKVLAIDTPNDFEGRVSRLTRKYRASEWVKPGERQQLASPPLLDAWVSETVEADSPLLPEDKQMLEEWKKQAAQRSYQEALIITLAKAGASEVLKEANARFEAKFERFVEEVNAKAREQLDQMEGEGEASE